MLATVPDLSAMIANAKAADRQDFYGPSICGWRTTTRPGS